MNISHSNMCMKSTSCDSQTPHAQFSQDLATSGPTDVALLRVLHMLSVNIAVVLLHCLVALSNHDAEFASVKQLCFSMHRLVVPAHLESVCPPVQWMQTSKHCQRTMLAAATSMLFQILVLVLDRSNVIYEQSPRLSLG